MSIAATDAEGTPTLSDVPIESVTATIAVAIGLVVAVGLVPSAPAFSFSDVISMPFLPAFFFAFDSFLAVLETPLVAAPVSTMSMAVGITAAANT